MQKPLYLGFDLSIQQSKAIVVTSDLQAEQRAAFDFDANFYGFEIRKGVITDRIEQEVYAPVTL
jgi:sugar (pentulose or hexulose) kinase